jgi:hypothetical protein
LFGRPKADTDIGELYISLDGRSRLFELILAYLHSAHPEGIHSALGRIHLVGMLNNQIPSLGQISVPGFQIKMIPNEWI